MSWLGALSIRDVSCLRWTEERSARVAISDLMSLRCLAAGVIEACI